MRAILIIFGLAGLASAASAETFKCTDATGKVAYQDYPCTEPSHSEYQGKVRAQEKAAADEASRINREKRDAEVARINAENVRRESAAPSYDHAAYLEQAKRAAKTFDEARPGMSFRTLSAMLSPTKTHTLRSSSGEHRFDDFCVPLEYGGGGTMYYVHSANGSIVTISTNRQLCGN